LAALGFPKPDLQRPAITGPHGKAATDASTDQGGVKRRELPCGPIAFLGHADGIDGYCVLTWSLDRRLVVRRKVFLNFALADHLIVQKLLRIERPPIDARKRLW